ncbi:MAG: SprT family zinc-dependent metalloprotease [Gammaproteobacteria bacterium]|nr:SprT family zinc-dependent metalloprotease [Gammaproteobacteria bacterium]
MTTDRLHIDVRGIAVEVVRKNIKHLYVGVYPPGGRVRVSAPLRIDKDAIRLAVISRLGWIRKRQAQFEQQERQSEREYVSGESHYFEGRRYRLDVIEQNCPPAVLRLDNNTIILSVRPGSDHVKREKVLDKWYRSQLRDRLPLLVDKWEKKIGVKVKDIRIRKMKTRWGTCNRRARRIWLNLELMKKSASCLEYVVVHELVHLIERKHNKRFKDLMDKYLPHWRNHRDELNRAPLAHGNWEY